jgi:LCP family protein required for cell wall assembly
MRLLWTNIQSSLIFIFAGTLLATAQGMEKTTSGFDTQNWRRRQPMARRTVYNRDLLDDPIRPRNRGVLYARRRRDQSTAWIAVAIFCVMAAAACGLGVIIVQGMRNTVARHTSALSAKIEPTLPASAPVSLTGEKTQKTNILLLGSDQRKGDGGFRTDVILFISIDPVEKTVTAVSFPRDMWVEPRPNDGMKINMVQGLYGFEGTARMFDANFDIIPKYYLLTNFDGFKEIVDKLGGVDIAVGQSLTDDCDLPQQKDGDCTVDPGTVHMDGATALWYVRSRHTSSDIDRMRRMQEVTTAMFNRLMSLNALTKIGDLYTEFSKNVETNLRVKDILPLLPVASEVFNHHEKIKRIAIGEDYATPTYSWNGMWILLPDLDAIKGMLKEAGVE